MFYGHALTAKRLGSLTHAPIWQGALLPISRQFTEAPFGCRIGSFWEEQTKSSVNFFPDARR